MITEDEAKTRACFRAATFAGSQQIADGPGPHCIASQCMAWAWQSEPYEYCTMDNREPDPDKRGWVRIAAGNPPAPAGDGWEHCSEVRQKDGFVVGVLEQQWRRPNKYRRGYCASARS